MDRVEFSTREQLVAAGDGMYDARDACYLWSRRKRFGLFITPALRRTASLIEHGRALTQSRLLSRLLSLALRFLESL